MSRSPTPPPRFDWSAEHAGLKRELSRFRSLLARSLPARGASSPWKRRFEELRHQWELLAQRLEGRWARGAESEIALDAELDVSRRERLQLRTLVELDERFDAAESVEACLTETLRALAPVIANDGAMMNLHDIVPDGGLRVTTARPGRRAWPLSSDLELCEHLLAGASDGRRIVIEGRPVGADARAHGRMTHWLAVGIAHRDSHYGSLVMGRRLGAHPFDEDEIAVAERIVSRLGRALASRVGAGVRALPGIGLRPEGFDHLRGESPALRQAVALAARLAASDGPVLFEGEIGTGRETLARAIHTRSARAGKPFVVLRGADLPQPHVAERLFGVHRVEPDGTVTDRPGDLELAKGGSLYIDELAALDNVLQVQLVRLLNELTFERVGERKARRADIRLMLATTQHIEDAVTHGRIREDLFYLVLAGRIALPPLRERAGDIVELARRFAIETGHRAGKRIDGIDQDTAALLLAASFPGNIRQLSQIIERAVFMSGRPLIGAGDLPEDFAAEVIAAPLDTSDWIEQAAQGVRASVGAGRGGDYAAFRRVRASVQRALSAAFVASVRKAVGPQPARAARHLGVHRAQWWRLMRDAEPESVAPAQGDDGGDDDAQKQ